MSVLTRRSFIAGSTVGAAGTLLAPGGAMAAMQPVYDGETAPEATGWRTTVLRGGAESDPSHAVELPPGDETEQRLYLEVRRTGEVFNDVYRKGPLVYLDALEEIDHLLRDWRRDEVKKIDRTLIALISHIQGRIGFENPLSIVSGYRSQATNDMLRRNRRGAAKNSYHIKGMAADISFRGVTRATLRKLALEMHAGGVGYYPRSGFLHVDTGPVRTWRG